MSPHQAHNHPWRRYKTTGVIRKGLDEYRIEDKSNMPAAEATDYCKEILEDVAQLPEATRPALTAKIALIQKFAEEKLYVTNAQANALVVIHDGVIRCLKKQQQP